MVNRSSRLLAWTAFSGACLIASPGWGQSKQVVEAIERIEPGIVEVRVPPGGEEPRQARPRIREEPIAPNGSSEEEVITPRAALRAWIIGGQMTNTTQIPIGGNPTQTGIIVGDGDRVLTILKQVPKADSKYEITTGDLARKKAKAIAYDAVTGCAVLQLEAPVTDVQRLKIDESHLRKGVAAAVVWKRGNTTVAGYGIVATSTYWAEGYTDVFEISVPTAAGMMGAAVVGEDCQLLGIVAPEQSTSSATASQVIPGEALVRLLKQEPESGIAVLHQGMLGIALNELDDNGRMSVQIGNVTEDSPAGEAGVHQGQKLVSVNGKEVHAVSDVLGELRRQRAGDRIELVVEDQDDKEQRLTIELARAPLRDLESTLTINGFHPFSPLILTGPPVSASVPISPAMPTAPSMPNQPAAPGAIRPPTVVVPNRIQVERSHLEESIRDLTRQIQDLKKELEKANK